MGSRPRTSDARGFVVLDNLNRDLRFAVRRLRRSPAFAAGVIATMAVGVATAVGVGTLVFGVLLRPLPYASPETLVRVLVATPGLDTRATESSPGLFVYFRERAQSFASLGSYYVNDGVTITDGPQAERTTAARLSPSVLEMLGTRPAVGRLFRDEDTRVSDDGPVLISHDLWVRRFARDPDVVGKTIEVNRGRRLIVGVLPQGFDFPSPSVTVWYPSEVSARRADLDDRYLSVIARLRPGVTAREAEAELRALLPHLSDRFPETSAEAVRASGLTASVQTLKDATVEPVRAELTLLGVMVVAVLLIATANVATLFLLRAERLRGEVAVSRALGATRAAIAQRFVSEGLIVGIAGGIIAMPLVALMVAAKFGFSTTQIPRLHDVDLSWSVFAALWLLVVLIGAALGVVAAARAGNTGTDGVIGAEARSAGRATGGRGWRRVQRSLVVAQVAVALALLLGAALMGQSLWRLSQVDIGFSARRALTFQVVLPFGPYPRYQNTAAFHLSVVRELGALSGVGDVTAAMVLPLDPVAGLSQRVATDGELGVREATAHGNVVAANYFRTMGIPLRAGRAFAPGDMRAERPGVILSASLARELFGETSAIGQEIRIADSRTYPPYRVLGVVGDVYGARIQDGILPMLYFPLVSDVPLAPADPAAPYRSPIPYNPTGMRFVIVTNARTSALVPAIRRIVREGDPKVPVHDLSTIETMIAGATARARLTMLLLSAAAAAALLLSAIGLYSVIAYAVAGRRRELGVRLALGATPGAIAALVVRDGLALVGVGVVIGIAVSLGASRVIRGALFDVSPTSPLIYSAGTIVIILVALASTYFPARKAARTDAACTLRTE